MRIDLHVCPLRTQDFFNTYPHTPLKTTTSVTTGNNNHTGIVPRIPFRRKIRSIESSARGVEQRDRVAAPLPRRRRHVDNRRSALCQLCISINQSVMFPGHGEQSIKDIDAWTRGTDEPNSEINSAESRLRIASILFDFVFSDWYRQRFRYPCNGEPIYSILLEAAMDRGWKSADIIGNM